MDVNKNLHKYVGLHLTYGAVQGKQTVFNRCHNGMTTSFIRKQTSFYTHEVFHLKFINA